MNHYKFCCDVLLNMGVAYQGWLRRKRAIHNLAEKLRFGSWAAGLLSWEMCYVVLHNGCLYVYKDEKQAKPEKAVSLFGYTQVLRASELKQKEVAWPFKIVYVLDTDAKVHCFNAASEDDMKKWMSHVKTEMILANNISYTDDSLASCEDYSDLETPVSTRNYFRNMQNLDEIQNTLGSDADLEVYTYPRDIEQPTSCPTDDDGTYEPAPIPASGHLQPTPDDGTYEPAPIPAARHPQPTPDKITSRTRSAANSHVQPKASRRPLPPTPTSVSADEVETSSVKPLTDEPPSPQQHHQQHHQHQQQQKTARSRVKPAVPCKPQQLPRVAVDVSSSAEYTDSTTTHTQSCDDSNASADTQPAVSSAGTLADSDAQPLTDDSSTDSRCRPAGGEDNDVRTHADDASHLSTAVSESSPPALPSRERRPRGADNITDTAAPVASPSQTRRGPCPRPPTHNNPAADNKPLTEVLSPVADSSCGAVKPAPPPPPARQRRRQDTLTADAGSAVNGWSESASDSEAAATWTGDPGEGNRLMMQLEEEGTYMVRPSWDCCSKTLLVVAEFQLRKYKVHVNQDQKYSLQANFTHMFDSVPQLITFYKDNDLPNRCTKLSKPYSELLDQLSVKPG